jgi:hypothetical protein
MRGLVAMPFRAVPWLLVLLPFSGGRVLDLVPLYSGEGIGETTYSFLLCSPVSLSQFFKSVLLLLSEVWEFFYFCLVEAVDYWVFLFLDEGFLNLRCVSL